MMYVGEGKYVRIVDIFPCNSVYIYILCIPVAVTLNVVASLVHLKLKFHNLHNESVMIKVGLEGAKRIYQELQQDWGECKVMEINVSSLAILLKSMNIHHPAGRTYHASQVSKSSWSNNLQTTKNKWWQAHLVMFIALLGCFFFV